MADFDPDKFLAETAPKDSKFDPDQFLAETEPAAAPSASAIRKFAQGGSAMLSDELAGGAEAIGQAIGVKGAGGPIKDISLDNNGPTLDWEVLRDAYRRGRQRELDTLKKDAKDNPKVSTIAEIAGAVTSPVNKIAPNASIAKQAAAVGAVTGFGASEADDLKGVAKDTITGAGIGLVTGKGLDVVGNKAAVLKDKVGNYFKKGAEQLAENATGATRVQAEKFGKDSGRYLLDEGIVSFGDHVDDVARKANSKIAKAEKGIDRSLKSLDEKGVQVSQDKIIENIQQRISEMSKDSSKADVVKKLKTMIDDIILTGESNLSVSEAEQVKRGFNKMAKNWQDPEKGEAGKIAYRAYRDAVEESAQAANPKIAKTFKEAKNTYGKLTPIADAAEKRSQQLNQSPLGGLLDVAAIVGGGTQSDDPVSGLIMGASAALLRRKVSPRLGSSMASIFDQASKQLLKSPQAAELAATNPKAFKAAVSKVVDAVTESNSSAMPLPKAAENEEPPKGEKKWANDGLKKVIEHDSSLSDSATEQLMKSKKGRDLLIQASELKPGTKAMDKVVNKIRSSSVNKGEE